jgi:ubiquinone/menaquinone biosynthesis C-methylase UbiE
VAPEEGDTLQYDTTYRRFADDVYSSMRSEVFGEDIGQNSWSTADEQRIFFEWLALGPCSELLEVASGSGGPGLFTAETTGCRVTCVDIHAAGVAVAGDAARQRGLAEQAQFVVADGWEGLPFADESFDAVICVDSINHLYD